MWRHKRNMDIVITYVNCEDTEWLKSYHSVLPHSEIILRRFRDWGTLRYVLRGIDKCMPFIDNVFLVVSEESQLPEYINRETLKVVYHKDFIPEKFLPTFNSNTIETFLWKIPGLSEEFIYFNDDMIPLKLIKEEELYENGLPCYMKNPYNISSKQFKRIVENCNVFAKAAIGINRFRGNISLFYTQHTFTPFLKSECEACYKEIEDMILLTQTQVRSGENPSQFMYSAYCYYQGKCILKDISYEFFFISNKGIGVDSICNEILSNKWDSICLNDASDDFTEDMVNTWKLRLENALNQVLPNPSKYEK